MPNNELELYEGELAPNAEWVHEKSAEVIKIDFKYLLKAYR